jgi:hypothetical protein
MRRWDAHRRRRATVASDLDIQSLSLYTELMVLVQGSDILYDMRHGEDDRRATSTLPTSEGGLLRPRKGRYLNGLTRLVAALL